MHAVMRAFDQSPPVAHPIASEMAGSLEKQFVYASGVNYIFLQWCCAEYTSAMDAARAWVGRVFRNAAYKSMRRIMATSLRIFLWRSRVPAFRCPSIQYCVHPEPVLRAIEPLGGLPM